MSVFARQLRECQPKSTRARRWTFVCYDQLHDGIGPLATMAPADAGIVLVESAAKARRRPYHKQKLALLLTNVRHFALEQARRGVAVRHVATDGDYASALAAIVKELGPLTAQRPAEHEMRTELAPLFANGSLVEVPHGGWLTTSADFAAASGPPWRMDAFYRGVRQRTGVLMEKGKPLGGKYSFDAENRRAWNGEPAAPTPPMFAVDDVTREVCDLVATRFAQHPGTLRPEHLPATHDDAETQWRWALRECLPTFGPFEDAMSTRSSGLFHSRISPLLNLHRLLPARVVRDVANAPLPLPSREGFVRQILGWREFVRHVHEATDGLRTVAGRPLPHDVLDRRDALAPAFWGKRSGLACLDHVVADVWREGYSHHITRLMVLGNLATLFGMSAHELSDWFWIAYVDAYDWVVQPNVLAMATFALGEVMTTKPYVSGAAYIAKMSDYCRGCAFDPKKNCPVTRAYWHFLAQHHDVLDGNQRMAMPLRSAAKRSAAEREKDAAVVAWVKSELARGRALDPADSP